MQENGLIRNIRLILKFITSQPGKQTIAMNILPNISRKQTVKIGRLIDYNIRNIFLQKSYTKSGREAITRPFSKKSKLSISLDH